MTSFGFIELVAILTTLGGFGVNANPNAPSPATVMKYAPADADVMFHADLQAVVPDNYKAFNALPNHAMIKGNASAREAVQDAIRELDVALSSVKGFTGIDLVEDLHSITAWIKLSSAGTPEMLVVLRGRLSSDIPERLSKMIGGNVEQVEGTPVLIAPDGSAKLAMKDGELLFGVPSWMDARLSKKWRAQRPRAGSAGASITAMLRDRPFLFMASSPSKIAAKRILQELPGRDNVAADLVNGHSFAAVSLRHNGVSWSWDATSKDGYERAVMASEGVLDLFRSGHFAARGFARVALSALRSYAGQEPAIDMILRHQGEFMKLVTEITGDGKFRVDFKRKPGKRSIAVKATGQKLSDVLPVAGVVPLVGAGMWLALSGGSQSSIEAATADTAKAHAEVRAAEPAAVQPAQPAPDSGLDVQKVYRSVKRARGL